MDSRAQMTEDLNENGVRRSPLGWRHSQFFARSTNLEENNDFLLSIGYSAVWNYIREILDSFFKELSM